MASNETKNPRRAQMRGPGGPGGAGGGGSDPGGPGQRL